MSDKAIVTVTCTVCGTKYQKEFRPHRMRRPVVCHKCSARRNSPHRKRAGER